MGIIWIKGLPGFAGRHYFEHESFLYFYILNKNYTEIGIGVAKDANGTLYWTQMFIGR